MSALKRTKVKRKVKVRKKSVSVRKKVGEEVKLGKVEGEGIFYVPKAYPRLVEFSERFVSEEGMILERLLEKQAFIVLEEDFQNSFHKTRFAELYMKTPRISELTEVVEYLSKVIPSSTHDQMNWFIEKYEDDPNTAILHIWTQWYKVTQPINFALILDGQRTFELGEKNVKYIRETLKKEYLHNYKTILKYSMKFIRMVNYFIVKMATKENTENRVTHRGVRATVFENIKVGQVFRVMNFQCTSEKEEVAKQFCSWDNSDVKEKSLIHFQIPKGCFNAGKIGELGCQEYQYQKETLIPPYTCCKLVKREGDEIWLEVAKDNKAAEFTYFSF